MVLVVILRFNTGSFERLQLKILLNRNYCSSDKLFTILLDVYVMDLHFLHLQFLRSILQELYHIQSDPFCFVNSRQQKLSVQKVPWKEC